MLDNQSAIWFYSLQIQKIKSSVAANDAIHAESLVWNYLWPGTEGQPLAPMNFQNRTENSTPGTLYLLEPIVVSKVITEILHRYPVQVVEMLQQLIVAYIPSTILKLHVRSTWSVPSPHKLEIEIVRQLIFHQIASGKDFHCGNSMESCKL